MNVAGVNFQLINYEQSRVESTYCIVVLLRVNDLFAIQEICRDDVVDSTDQLVEGVDVCRDEYRRMRYVFVGLLLQEFWFKQKLSTSVVNQSAKDISELIGFLR